MLLLMDEFKLIKIGLTKNILKTPFCYIHYVFEKPWFAQFHNKVCHCWSYKSKIQNWISSMKQETTMHRQTSAIERCNDAVWVGEQILWKNTHKRRVLRVNFALKTWAKVVNIFSLMPDAANQFTNYIPSSKWIWFIFGNVRISVCFSA